MILLAVMSDSRVNGKANEGDMESSWTFFFGSFWGSFFARAKRGRVVQSEYEKSNRRPDPARPDPTRHPKFKELKFSQTRQKASFKIDHAEFSGASFTF